MSVYTPSAVAQEALDAIGWPETLGDIEDGTKHAQVLLRKYWTCLQQILRAVHWNFARKTAEMQLIADASGNTPNVGTLVPTGWVYMYAYPNDCMKVRFVPANYANPSAVVPTGNIQIPQTPLVSGMGVNPVPQRIIPTRFLVAVDTNYPPPNGAQWAEVQGVSPEGRTVILSNVRYAQVIYTTYARYPSQWDPLFRAAMVAFLASEVAMPIWAEKNPQFGLQMRNEQAAIVREKVTQARITDGNEAIATTDIPVDWMNIRRSGGPTMFGGAWGMGDGMGFAGDGMFFGAWDTLTVAGSTF